MFAKRRDERFGELPVSYERNVEVDRFAADGEAVGRFALMRMRGDIDDEIKLVAFEKVRDVGLARATYLVHLVARDALLAQEVCRVLRRIELEFHICEQPHRR